MSRTEIGKNWKQGRWEDNRAGQGNDGSLLFNCTYYNEDAMDRRTQRLEGN